MAVPEKKFFDPEDDGEGKPLGQQFRDFVKKAFDDPRCKQIQLEKLDMILGLVADRLPGSLNMECQQFFRFADTIGQSSEDKRLQFIIDSITLSGGEGPSATGKLSPVKKIPLTLSSLHTEFTVEDICALPNYIRLHEMARNMDVAIKLIGAANSDPQRQSLGMPVLIIDLEKSYDEGSFDQDAFYPTLPPRKKKRPGNDFTI